MVHMMEATSSSESALVTRNLQEERRGVKRKISLTSCDMCEREEAKYKCPNCLKYSCSLPCVKQHKRLSGCCGVRDQTAFVPLSQFEEINLRNDYCFLEETARVADRPRRDALLREAPRQMCLTAVVRNARAAKVDMKLLPKFFTRHQENTTFYSKAERKLFWHLKLFFPQCSAEYTDRAAEDRVLENILIDYVHPFESDPVKRQRLKIYVHAYPDQLCVFLKSEKRSPNSVKYHELDVRKSLRENLMFKTVLEYPEVHVVLKEHRQEYLVHMPGRSCVVARGDGPPRSLPAGTLSPLTSPAAPGAPRDLEAPIKREGGTRVTATETELEEGEIRSDEEEEEQDEDEHKPCDYDAGSAYQSVTMETNSCLLHDVKEEEMDDFHYCATAKHQSVTIETNKQGSDVDDSIAAVNDQNVTMEMAGLPSSPDKNVVDGNDRCLGDVDSLRDPNVQNVEDRPLRGGDDELGGKHQHDKAGNGVVDEASITMETPDRPLPHSSCGDGGNGHEHAEAERRGPCHSSDFALPDDVASGCGLQLDGGDLGGAGLAEPGEVAQTDGRVCTAPLSAGPNIAAGGISQGNGKTEAPQSVHSGGETQAVGVALGEGPPSD